jgi:hypothetical protein
MSEPSTKPGTSAEDNKITLDELSEEELDGVSGGVKVAVGAERPVVGAERPVAAPATKIVK